MGVGLWSCILLWIFDPIGGESSLSLCADIGGVL